LTDRIGERRVVALPSLAAGLVGLINHPKVLQPAVRACEREWADGAVDGANL
jgi:hypothetical protein